MHRKIIARNTSVPGTLQSSPYERAWSQTWARETEHWFKMIFCSPPVKSSLQHIQWKLCYWSQWGQISFHIFTSVEVLPTWKQFGLGKRWELGTNCFWPFPFRNLTETISLFVPLPPISHQKKYFLWVTINFISKHFILLGEPGFQVVWFIGRVYLGRYCFLIFLLSNPKQRAIQGYIKNYRYLLVKFDLLSPNQ